MKCPKCGEKTKVEEKRTLEEAIARSLPGVNAVTVDMSDSIRVRRCTSCGYRFCTFEAGVLQGEIKFRA